MIPPDQQPPTQSQRLADSAFFALGELASIGIVTVEHSQRATGDGEPQLVLTVVANIPEDWKPTLSK